MLERVAAQLTRWCVRFIPDGYVIAGVLTAVVVALAWILTPKGAIEIVSFWGEGFWGFIPFTLQMSMVVLTGTIVADSPLVRRGLIRLAAIPQTPRAALALTALVSMGLALVNWGISIIASAILARHIGARRIGVDFRLLVATAYLGLGCMWHSGLSASAPLTSADPTQGFVKSYLLAPVPITETVLSPFNLGLAALVLVVMTLASTVMHPKDPVAAPSALSAEEDERDREEKARGGLTPAEWLERSPLINLFFAAGVFLFLPWFIRTQGILRININHVNLLFFGVGALLHWTPASLLRSAERGGRFVWGVLLQFGLYAGVAGVLDKSGLAAEVAGLFSRAVSAERFPLFVVWYSGVLNYLVPSGGAKWFIEVQYLADAARALGVPLGKTIVAYAWGDMLTDIIQPFWAIPLLAMARLGFRDVMGYCLTFFLVYATVVSVAFVAYGYL